MLAVALVVGFVLLERRPDAMAPVSLFSSRVFTAANLMTFLVYGALGAVLFFLVLQLQVTGGYSAIQAGVSTLPMTVVMLLLSSRLSVLAARTGPRLPMTVGPLVCATGALLLSRRRREVDVPAPTSSRGSCCSPSAWPRWSRR